MFKDHKLQKKIAGFLNSELACAVFFLLVGLLLVIFPVQTVDITCRIIFGLLLLFAGVHNIVIYLSERVQTTVITMFSGVIVLVLGWFMFENPQVVVKLLPRMLGALAIVDSCWMIRVFLKLRKMENPMANSFIIAGAASIVLGAIIMINPFSKVRTTILFAGIVFMAKGIVDIVFYIMRKKLFPNPAPSAASVGEETHEMPGAASDMIQPSTPYDTYPNTHVTEEPEKKHHGFGSLFGKEEEERHFGDAAVSDADQMPEEPKTDAPEEWQN